MTPEERAAKCLELHADKASNDSMLLPADLESRIAAAIRDAEAAEREECALTCLELWQNAPNTWPDYKQNAVSAGCLASAAAIRKRGEGK